MFLTVRQKLFRKVFVQVFNAKYKHKSTHWSVQVKNKQATSRALEHFDDFYKKVYEKSWASIRQGLLADRKYAAVVNNYSDNEEVMTKLENNGALNIKTLFNLEKQYMKEKKENEERNRRLENVFKLDEVVDLKGKDNHANIKENTELDLGRIEEKSARIDEIENKTSIKEPLYNSVMESLKNAEIDSSRIVTPGISDLSSALYEFIPATKLKGKEDWIPETQHYKYYETTSKFSIKVEKENDLHFPEHLNVYCFEKSNHTQFPSPRTGSTGVLDYYLLDGASILPVLALGLQPGDRILDVCCAPGGKAFVALQTLYPSVVVCNDVESSRVTRIKHVLKQYLYDLNERWLSTGKVSLTQEDGQVMEHEGYDRVLVDVPCTNDRLSLHENDNNWFKSARTKERLQLPETQAALLANALKMVRVGGTVVYSTCSLSPIQNDGIVNMALRKMWEETELEFVVKDLSPALKAAESVFRFADSGLLRYGHLVIPYLPQNYGPMYFCKIERNK